MFIVVATASVKLDAYAAAKYGAKYCLDLSATLPMGVPVCAPLSAVEASVQKVKLADGAIPALVGHGLTADPIQEASLEGAIPT